MRPTFVQLEAFYWIARLGSVKDAARRLHVAPPTISLRIDQFEGAVGSPLFERAGRGLSLTPKGEALVPRVGAVIEEYGRIREIVGGQRLSLGILRIGATETFAQACLSAFMREIESRYSGLELEFVVRTSAELELGVLERRLDVAFAINPTGDPKLTPGAAWRPARHLGGDTRLRPVVAAASIRFAWGDRDHQSASGAELAADH